MSNKTIRIAIDCMGGDHGLPVTLPAAVKFAQEHPDTHCLLVGDQTRIEAQLRALPQIAGIGSPLSTPAGGWKWMVRARLTCVASASLPCGSPPRRSRTIRPTLVFQQEIPERGSLFRVMCSRP